jgi:citrate/tricarballylate utilization protein
MHICNACRYCEGFCAVFPAMESRTVFSNADLAYLANLCHNCRGCYYSCQYAPPHEFALNLPRTLAQVRNDSYTYYAWPDALGRLFERNGVVVSLVAAFSLALVMVLAAGLRAPHILYSPHKGPGAFYQVVPSLAMSALAVLTFGFSLLAMAIGFLRFWRDTGGKAAELISLRPLSQAISDVLTLRNLGGAGGGCNDKNEAYSTTRRNYHHFLFYGFLLCTGSTIVAGIYDHFLHRIAPYPFFSIPVLLGTVGGVGMLIGCGGLMALKIVGDQTPSERSLLGADVALILLLGMSSLTGLLLLALRSTSAMGIFLALHLGSILALFLVLPYSRFVHGVYRSAALLRYALERKIPAAPAEHQV